MGSTAEPERFGKVRPLKSKGRTPYKSLYRQVGLLIKFRCGRSVTASPRTGNVLTSTFDVSPSQVIRASGLVKLLVHPSSFLLFGFTSFLFLGRNMIFHQKQNGRTFPYRAVRPVAYHQVFQEFLRHT